MRIDGREVGPGHPPYVVAEMSGEHLGKLENAFALIAAAKEADADAIKVQLYDPTRLAEARGGREMRAPPPWEHLSLRELYTSAHTPSDWFPQLFSCARQKGITLFSSVFDSEGVDYLKRLGCPAYKIASPEITCLPLIRKAAETRKPLVISTGMASDADVIAALDETCPEDIQRSRWQVKHLCDVAILHCVSSYPCRITDANLRRIEELTEHTLIVGYSDHTQGNTAAVVAAGLGASIIEKHITLDRKNHGPDVEFSLEPDEFKKFCRDVKNAYASLGSGKRPASEAPYRSLRRKA